MLEKREWDTWGAEISFTHVGDGLTVDVGWAAHLGETYRWCTKSIYMPASSTPEIVKVALGGRWKHEGIPAGRRISAQAVVALEGKLPDNNSTTAKMDSHLYDVDAILEQTFRDVYLTRE